MRVRVKFFAILRDRAGCAETDIDLPDGSTAAGAVDALVGKFPAIAHFISRAAVAVNLEYSNLDTILKDDDELALIPPVSGGVI